MNTAGIQPQKAAHTIETVDLDPPHGSRIYATTSGVRIQYASADKDKIVNWLDGIKTRMTSPPGPPKARCPMCDGTGVLNASTTPLLCPLCKGASVVALDVAVGYAKSIGGHDSPVQAPE